MLRADIPSTWASTSLQRRTERGVPSHMAAATTCSGAFGRPRIVRARTATCSSLADGRSTVYVAVRNVSLDGEFDRFVRGGSPKRGGYTIGDARKECFVGEIDVGRQG